MTRDSFLSQLSVCCPRTRTIDEIELILENAGIENVEQVPNDEYTRLTVPFSDAYPKVRYYFEHKNEQGLLITTRVIVHPFSNFMYARTQLSLPDGEVMDYFFVTL